MTYTIAQFLAAAVAAEVSMIDAQHICDTLVKMNGENVKVGDFRKMTKYDHPFENGEIVLITVVETDTESCLLYKAMNYKGVNEWIEADTHEPTTETF